MPGVDLEVGRERWRRRGTARSDGVRTACRAGAGRPRDWGNGEVREMVEVVQSVEELQVEGGGGLAVDLDFGRVACGHSCSIFV